MIASQSDFEFKNIYLLDKFELFSKRRGKSFRYVRYNGNNYDDLCEFIHGISPNTTIWEEKHLNKNTYYSYYGRTGEFMEIPIWELRCCIANNPFLVKENKLFSLALTKQEAQNYLKLSESNRVFCYNHIENDYSYCESNGYMIVNKDHLLGLSCMELNDNEEWYIGINDSLHVKGNICIPRYEKDTHTVHFDYDIRAKADRIIDLIYEANRLSFFNRNKLLVFQPSWEDSLRYRKLYKKSGSEILIKEFIQTVYNFLYEETKDYPHFNKYTSKVKKTRMTLPDTFRYHRFVIEIGELRNHFDHGVSEYEPTNDCSINDIYLKYMRTNRTVKRPSDYDTMQIGILNGFIGFLEELVDYLVRQRIVEDYIGIDENGNVYCKDVLLPREFGSLQGCKCKISSVVKNTVTPLCNSYEYFCQYPTEIYKQATGTIQKRNNHIICQDILLQDSLELFIGESISIDCVEATTKEFRDLGLLFVAKKGIITFNKPITNKITIKNNTPFVNTIALPIKWYHYQDFKVGIIGYKFEKEYNTIKLDPIVIIKEGIVQYDNNNKRYYCGNVLLPDYASKYLGKQVNLMRLLPNKLNLSQYEYFCNSIIEV